MKRTGLLLLLLALCLGFASFATAETACVVRSDTYAAFIDGDGHLFLSGSENAINKKPASAVVAIDPYRVLFISPDEFLGANDLYMIDLDNYKETLIASGVQAVCLADEDTVYYVQDANRKQLMRCDLNTLSPQVATAAQEPIDRLYLSTEGLVFGLVDQAGAMLFVPETGRFETYGESLPRSGLLTDSYEVYLTDDGELYLKNDFNFGSALIDSDVTAFARMKGVIYYITRAGVNLRLKAYDPAAQTTKLVVTPGVRMENQLTASDDALFMLTTDCDVCKVNVDKGTLSVFKRYSDLSGYNLPTGYDVQGLRIEAMSGQLNVYAVLKEKAAKPDFSFIEFESEADVSEPLYRLIDRIPLRSEENAFDVLKPAAQYAPLSRGSRGDAVRAIQGPLKELGYYDYYVDGIFGPRTQAAVQLLQFDLDRPVTGVADAELQRIILSGKLGHYDPYLALTRGSRGMRVRLMQERLRELGYLADAADGIFGPRTQKAVQLFQRENGLDVSDAATRETLKRLYSDLATRCSSYIDLYPGDTGYRVRELNNRLKELYYLECSPGSSYTSRTTSAVRMFQRTAGMRETGEATQAVLRALFAPDAPEAPGYIVLSRGDCNHRVERLQRRLRELGYFTGDVDGYFGKKTKEAVALFQKKVGLKPTGVATVRTQQLLFSKDAPEYVKPTVIGVPDIYVEDYDRVVDDIYFISEDSSASGYIVFSWDAEGSVDYYNVRIKDSDGDVYVDTDTLQTSTGVSIATLDYDMIYTLRITAYPEDGEKKHITKAEVSFARVDPEEEEEEEDEEAIGNVGVPVISIDEVVRLESGVTYVPRGAVTFRWHAEGDVEEYDVEFCDETDNVIYGTTTSEEMGVISTEAMNEGEIYTIFVYAVPTNGDLSNARVKFKRFALPEIELPEPDPTPIPTPSPTPEPTLEPIEEEGPEPEEKTGEEPEETLEPVPVIEETLEPVATETPVPPLEETPAPVDEPIPEGEMPEYTEEETPTEPEGDGSGAPESEDWGEPMPAQAEAVQAPEITLSRVAYTEGGIQYIEGDELTMSWSSDGDVADYYVELRDSGDIVLDSRTIDANSLSARTAALNPAEVYTLYVTANPKDAARAAATGSATFALAPAAAEAPEEDAGNMPEEGEEEQPADVGGEPITPDYQEPKDAYEEPEDTYEESEETYQEPEDTYEEPEDTWQEPEETYEEPEDTYQEPEETYQEPEDTWQDNWDDAPDDASGERLDVSYEDDSETWQEPEDTYQDAWDEEPEDASGDRLDVSYEDNSEGNQDTDDGYSDDYEDDYSDDAGDSGMSADEIKSMQKRLVKLGWLAKKSYSAGTLDDVTVDAVSRFQDYCNSEYGMALPMIDYYAPSVDWETLDLILNSDYANPDA